MNTHSLVSIEDYSKEEILEVLKLASAFEANQNQRLLEGKVVASLFFEPSTRTRLSFETAIIRLGGRIIGFTDASSSSVTKGETLKDTIKMVDNYADLIVMRHPVEGAARYASEVAVHPVVNAGDGANQHPSQTMLDLYSIYKTQGTLENLDICMVGDLKYGRTVHSLLQAMSHFHPTFHFVAPESLQMPEAYKLHLKALNIPYYEHTELDEVIGKADILYMTRVQRERFADPLEYEKVKNVYILRNAMLANAKENMRILHPLPRVNEIDVDVDENPIEDATVRIVGKDGLNVKVPAKKDGTYRVELERDIRYVMMASARGYLNQNFELKTGPEEKNETYIVDFYLSPISKPVVIDNIFYDFDKATLRPESKKALDEMIKMLNDNPNVTIELGAHTDRKGTDQYNERLAQRRAQSVVDYLIAGGIEAARLEAKGYGESVPKTINKKMAKQFDFLKEGDVLTEEFILALPPEQQEIADQINRRTEFKVLRTNYY